MDIEQLKLVLQTLQGISHDATGLAMLWLWLKFGASVAGHLFWGGVVLGVMYLVYRMILSGNGGDEHEQFMRNMRDQLRIGSPGSLTDSERRDTQAALVRLVAEHKVREKV